MRRWRRSDHEAGRVRRALVPLLLVLAALLALHMRAALAAIVLVLLAVFAMRRSNAARIGLVISAVLVCLPTALIGLAGAFLMLLLGAACLVVIVCLFVGGANEWYAFRPGARPRSGGIAPPIA